MSTTAIKTMAEAAADLRTFAANPQQRWRTGFDSIDYYIEGPAAGEVCTIIGRSYTGKSLLATNIMVNHTQAHSIFFSLEMPRRMAMGRLLAQYADFDAEAIRLAIKNNRIPDIIDTMTEEMAGHVIVDRSGLTVGDMRLIIEEYTDEFGQMPDFIQVDYLERIGGVKSSAEGWQAVEAAADQVKDLARDLNLPVFLYHQTNRSEPEHEPITEKSARGGGYTEADFVIGMWAPARDPKMPEGERKALWDTVRMNVIKNRHSGQMNEPWRPLEFVRSKSLRFLDQGALTNGAPEEYKSPYERAQEADGQLDIDEAIEHIEEASWD